MHYQWLIYIVGSFVQINASIYNAHVNEQLIFLLSFVQFINLIFLDAEFF